MTISPKDKCPCGSGRKYKKCCGMSSAANYEEQLERNYDLFRRTEARLARMAFGILLSLGVDVLEDARELFFCEMPIPESEEEEGNIDQMFASFLLFDYPALWKKSLIEEGKRDLPVTSIGDFLLSDGADSHLRKDEVIFLQAGLKTPVSWYVVEEVREGIEVTVRDLLDPQVHKVREYIASGILQPGICILARVVDAFGVKGFFGSYPRLLPPQAMAWVLDARDELPEYIKALQEGEGELPERLSLDMARRGIFTGLVNRWGEQMSSPAEVRNTDGDKLEFLGVEWRCSGNLRDIIVGLKPLIEETVAEQYDNVLQAISRLEKGEVKEINFCWHKESQGRTKSQGPIVVATFSLCKARMLAEVNSRERAESVQAKVAELLGKKVQVKGVKAVKPSRSRKEGDDGGVLTAAELEQHPEVRAKIEEMADAHWEGWFTTPIPMLENQTPREAAASERGRELLKALFQYYEAAQAKSGEANLFNPDLSALKARLGLTDMH